MTRIGGLAASALALLIGTGSAFAQSPGWAVNCEAGTPACTLALSLNNAENNRPIATFLALPGTDGDFIGAVIPLGTAVDAGMQIVVGEERLPVKVQVCFPDGCRGIVEVPEDYLDRLAEEDVAEIRFFPYREETPLAVPIPMEGFADALASARESLAAN